MLNQLRSYHHFAESDTQLKSLYHQFSEDKYSTGWMTPDENIVKEFLTYKETHTAPSLCTTEQCAFCFFQERCKFSKGE